MTSARPVVVVVGTRPEAVKLAPVVRALSTTSALRPVLICTGQHKELVETALDALELRPDHTLDIMRPGQTPNDVASAVLVRLPPLLSELAPAAVLVQGDTTSVLGASLAAYHLRIPVGHVEAGLRTFDHDNPFPEEMNREVTARLTRFHFCPTTVARENLLAERVPAARIHVTGNTVVDSLLWMLPKAPRPEANGEFVLVTLHRRESFGEPLRNVLRGLKDFLDTTPTARALWPLHPNPNVKAAADEVFGGDSRLIRLAPLAFAPFVGALQAARVVLSDSGGVQEEGPSLGKIVLVARETTERPEALDGGRNRLVGRDRHRVAAELARAWAEPPWSGPLPAPNPFGDGGAAERIARILVEALS